MDWPTSSPTISTAATCGTATWGSRAEPRFAAAVPLHCGDAPLTGAWRSRPAAWGAGCLLLLNGDGFLQLFRRPGPDPARLEAGPLLRYQDGNLLRGCGPGGLWGRTAFCGCDWIWTAPAIWWPAAPGSTPASSTATSRPRYPVLAAQRRQRHRAGVRTAAADHRRGRYAHQPGSHKCAPWCHDLDGDGAPDLICGSEDGRCTLGAAPICAGTGTRPPASLPNR